MNLSVRSRLTLLYIGTIALLFVAMFYFSYSIFSHAIFSSDILERFDHEFERRIDLAGKEIAVRKGPFVTGPDEYRHFFHRLFGVDLFLNPVCGQLVDFPERLHATPLIIVRNDALGGRFIPLSRGSYEAVLRDETAVETAGNVFSYPLRIFSKKVKDADGNEYLLQIGVSMENIDTTLVNVLVKFLSVWPLLLVIISFMGYYFVKRSFRPIRDIVATARSITAEDLSRRINTVESADEIGKLADTLNDMIGRIQRSFEQVRQFSDDVAHELRTPITVIKGEIEVALRSRRSADDYVETLRSLLEETEKLGVIIDNLLFLSRMDSKRIMVTFREMDLDLLVMDVYEEFCVQAREKNIALNLSRVDEIPIRGEEGLLRRLFVNLFQNAIKYTSPGGSIDVTLTAPNETGDGKGMKAIFIITDTGAGIPRKDLPRIFDRFYRVDKSRSGKTGGSGLGLTIVKKILDIHGGKITVKSRPGMGTSFYLFFP